jgi:hypothetical protein
MPEPCAQSLSKDTHVFLDVAKFDNAVRSGRLRSPGVQHEMEVLVFQRVMNHIGHKLANIAIRVEGALWIMPHRSAHGVTTSLHKPVGDYWP